MKKISVMIAGLSADPEKGKMARLVMKAIAEQEDMNLYPWALSEEAGKIIHPGVSAIDHLVLVPLNEHMSFLEKYHSDIDVIVDFTQPKSVNRNAEMYCKVGIPFVMGTTGGDREKLIKTVRKSKISAVIATNMLPQIVVFQEMLKFATEFPDSFKGFDLNIVESHQAPKPDPSGTAVGLLPFFDKLGMPYTADQIAKNMVRKPEKQKAMGIPEKYIDGHGWHTYTMKNKDGTVLLEFKHNVNGRNGYVDGALRAIRFNSGIKSRNRRIGWIFSMADVLRG